MVTTEDVRAWKKMDSADRIQNPSVGYKYEFMNHLHIQ